MPLPPVQTQKLAIDGWQGIDIERGPMERAVSSFERLENFDLVKHGVIRKISGSKQLLQFAEPGTVAVALRDYQATENDLPLIIVVDNMGVLYYIPEDFSQAFVVDDLIGSLLFLDSSPFVISLPLQDLPSAANRNYIFVTLGTLAQVKKWDGTPLGAVTVVGIANPGDSWAVQYQNSAVIPQIFYQSNSLATAIYQYTTPISSQGIPCVAGRRYRATWFNPKTGHDSSLFPLSLTPWPTQMDIVPPAGSTSKSLGTVFTTSDAPYLMAIPLFLDQLLNRTPGVLITPPQDGYTQLRFWRTLDGGTEYFLLPRLYGNLGEVVTDDNGAINYQGLDLAYGFGNPGGAEQNFGLYDGYIPHVAGADSFWWNPLDFDGLTNYTVDGAGQTGTNLTVAFHSDVDTFQLSSGQFMLPNDSTIYTIQGFSGAVMHIEPAIVTAPANGAQLTFLFTQPVQDVEMIVPFVTAEENGVAVNTDRLNDPPPFASWGVVYQNRLFLLDANNPTRIVYSRIANYESFPPDNEFIFTQADYDPITALLTGRQVGLVSQGADQQLVVGKSRESAKITGTDATDFAITSLFAETGIVHKRAAVVVEGNFLAWTRRGLEMLEPQQPVFIGAKIKDLFDTATFASGDTFGPSFTTYRRDGELLLGVNLDTPAADTTTGRINTIILMRPAIPIGSQAIGGLIYYESPFSLVTPLPVDFGVMLESGFGDDVRVLAGGNDGYIYQLFTGGIDGKTGLPLVALAQTQRLPQEDKDSRKIFRRIRFGGNIVTGDIGWNVSFSVDDGQTFTPPTRMFNETLIGLVGKQIILQITHNRAVGDDEDSPQLSNMTLEWVPIGVSRGDPA